ncbi:hypothetical protein [Roseomonas elaeocarpi]|uniref:Uncharacterized protein n=1 Tax=Roseomonas elaeocarpi TaxID=907779 RepID=A0ABV6JR44_9PROT
MSARLPEVLAQAGAARRLLLREGVTSLGLLEVEFVDSLPARRIGPGPTAVLPLPALEGEVPQLRLVLAGEDLAAYGGLELRLNGRPLALQPVPVPAEFDGLPGVLALAAALPDPAGGRNGRLELRLGWTLPHPDGTCLCGPALLAVDRPPQPLSQPAEAVPA